MMSVTVRGVVGELRWGYQPVAGVRAWTVTRVDGTYVLEGRVQDVNAFRIAQRPLVFVAPHRAGAWRWPVTELQIEGASLHATLGPRE